MYYTERTSKHIRPYLQENTGSRPLSHSQACKGRISSWVGDDQRIPAVVCYAFLPNLSNNSVTLCFFITYCDMYSLGSVVGYPGWLNKMRTQSSVCNCRFCCAASL